MTANSEGRQRRGDALARLKHRLARAGVETPGLDARLLLLEALGVNQVDLLTRPDEPLGEDAAAKLVAFAGRRLAGEPVARILGEREFWGLPFGLSPATLVPRPETETIVEEVLRHCEASRGGAYPWRILDLGTGSGCIVIALLCELRAAWGVGVDRSPEALATATANARRNGVADRAAFVASDWGRALDAQFDLVVSNPPYIATGDFAALAPEVRDHDPRLALDAGADGLDAYRAILSEATRLLGAEARVVLEIGAAQGAEVRALIGQAGLDLVHSRADLAGIERVLSAIIASRSLSGA